MKALAIIPARGGSKRIPRKNVRPFAGRPILAYSIDAALGSGIFEEVMVSTDDDEIAALARTLGASVPFLRSPETADDHATTAAVLLEVLGRYRDLGREFSHYGCLYPTAPFVTAARLVEAKRLLLDEGAESVMPVVRFGYPIQRALRLEAGLLAMREPEHLSTRSQDLLPMYHDAGQFYLGTVAGLAAAGSMLTPRTAPLVLSETEVQDIDHEDDWKLAEMKYHRLRS